ncbi:hypothetical protein DNB39_24635 [Escherichia coli]|nr:hypothetical protein [Escherichia coli]EGE2833828.1 hypothetical protein [Escherichia coli]CUA64396.1 Uncharacterised protein [Escherichia coli]HAJ2069241.1 hypothetical protein [Escherichia coli]HAJ2103656.1 hypothetical protein [Escherichia coli]
MRYPWSVSASRKYRSAHWMALRWDGNQRQAKMLSARFWCIFWDNGWFGGTWNALQSDLAEKTGTR